MALKAFLILVIDSNASFLLATVKPVSLYCWNSLLSHSSVGDGALGVGLVVGPGDGFVVGPGVRLLVGPGVGLLVGPGVGLDVVVLVFLGLHAHEHFSLTCSLMVAPYCSLSQNPSL